MRHAQDAHLLSVERLIFEQEVFVEGTELPLRMDDGNLQDPQQRRWPDVDRRHGAIVMGRVRKLRQAVSGEISVEPPSAPRGRSFGVVVEGAAGEPMAEPFLADVIPDCPHVRSGPMVVNVGAEHEGIAGVSFVVSEYGTDVDEKDVV